MKQEKRNHQFQRYSCKEFVRFPTIEFKEAFNKNKLHEVINYHKREAHTEQFLDEAEILVIEEVFSKLSKLDKLSPILDILSPIRMT